MALLFFILGFLVLGAAFVPLFLLWRRRQQIRFIRQTLAESDRATLTRRVIVSLSTLPDRIENLEPTLDCLMSQSRVPDEIVLAVPEFSIRQKKPYVLPKYLARYPLVRVLHCGKDWGPATKFIPVIQEELAAHRED